MLFTNLQAQKASIWAKKKREDQRCLHSALALVFYDVFPHPQKRVDSETEVNLS